MIRSSLQRVLDGHEPTLAEVYAVPIRYAFPSKLDLTARLSA